MSSEFVFAVGNPLKVPVSLNPTDLGMEERVQKISTEKALCVSDYF